LTLLLTLALGFLVTALAGEAQPAGKVYRLGLLAGSSQAPREQHAYEAFQQGLRDLGYVEGKNVILEYRYTEGHVDRLPALAAELVHRHVDIIVAAGAGYAAVLAAKQATTTIPIVMVSMATDPVETGLVEAWPIPAGPSRG
jgi:putative ABC transport system substrate-binding protein